MNQRTHAWLAVEAYRMVKKGGETDAELAGLGRLLGENLGDVVVASWLPDSLIKDMAYGHIFKMEKIPSANNQRFVVPLKDLLKKLPGGAALPDAALKPLAESDPEWWTAAYRVRNEFGGHLPARVNALCQTARDMLNMGDDEVQAFSGLKQKEKARLIAKNLLYSPRDVAVMLWMLSHYVADANVFVHCDGRALATGQTHSDIEANWGAQVPEFFAAESVLRKAEKAILGAAFPKGSRFEALSFAEKIPAMKSGDPWQQTVDICRASFAVSYAVVPASLAAVGGKKAVSYDDILSGKSGCCGEERFWEISRAVMHDAASAIAMFWAAVWKAHLHSKSEGKEGKALA